MGAFWNNIKLAMRAPVKLDNVKSGRTFTKGESGLYADGDIRIGSDLQKKGDKYIDNAVPSSAIKSIDYDPKTQNAKIQYTSGDKQYDFPMTVNEFKDFENAPSKGRWVAYTARRY